MKRDGLVCLASDKSFILTGRGLEVARELIGGAETPHDRLTKQEENEIKRISRSPAFELFQTGEAARILDTDFYDYLGASVRTPKGDFLGRLAIVQEAVDAHRSKINDRLSEKLSAHYTNGWSITFSMRSKRGNNYGDQSSTVCN